MNQRPLVSIVITTRNRREHLRRALQSCFAQGYDRLEVLVYDDASDDGTAAMVAAEFPAVRLTHVDDNQERLVLRNRAYAEARGKYILTIDDDCYFSETNLVERTVRAFAADERIGVVCLPLIEPLRERPANWRPFSARDGQDLCSFRAGACAFRAEAVLEVAGYREFLVHHQEERDLAMRLLDRGWRIVYCAAPSVVHLFSSQRDVERIATFSIRNSILITYLNVPLLRLPGHLAGTCLMSLLNQGRIGWLTRVRAVAGGLKACLRHRRDRRAITLASYRLSRKLPRHGAEDCEPSACPPVPERGPVAGHREAHLSATPGVV